jgi:hypothetical protein
MDMPNLRPRPQEWTLSDDVARGQIQRNVKYETIGMCSHAAKKIKRVFKMLYDVQQKQHIETPLVQRKEIAHLERNLGTSMLRPKLCSIRSYVIPKKLRIGKNLPQFGKNAPGTASNLTYGR